MNKYILVSGWKLPVLKVDTRIDMSGGKHLFIRTNTTYGVDESIDIKLSDESNKNQITQYQIYFKNWKYDMYYCGKDYQLENVPEAVEKLWMIEKADTYSAIWCNGVQLININFTVAKNNGYKYCTAARGKRIPTVIRFRNTASVEYTTGLGFNGKLDS